jgi:tetratricopeptide (TPR) repeat protein
MTSARKHARRITLLVVCHTIAFTQSTDLSPLLSPADTSTNAIRQALQSGQVARAASLITTLDPLTRNLWQGILAITQNDAHRAIRVLRKADAPKALGVAYYLAGQHILFREQMAEAIRRDPGDFGPYYYLGRHYDSDVDNAGEAVKWFRLALERNEGYAAALSHLGHCLERLGKIAEAEAAYNASLTVAQSQVGLARMRLVAGDAISALPFIEKAIALDSRDITALKLAARIYGALNRPGDVVRTLESAAVRAPRDASIQYQLVRAYQSVGATAKSEAALRDFERLRNIYGLGP